MAGGGLKGSCERMVYYRVETEPSREPRQLANSLYGLQRMHEATEGVAELLSALALQVEAAAQRAEVLETRALSNALYGLQGFSSSRQRTALPALLRALANWAKAAQAQSPEPRGFSAQGLGMALYGLQGISEEAEELLQALLPYVRASPLDGQAVGNALYGLQSLSSDFEGLHVRRGDLSCINSITRNHEVRGLAG